MPPIVIRRAQHSDLPDLSNIWHSKISFQQQIDRRLTLAENAQQKWIEHLGRMLNEERSRVWVVELQSSVVGYLIAMLHDLPPGLYPESIGYIPDMALDIHNPHPRLGQLLLEAARAWFAEYQVQNIVASVPHRQVVEQAFWRAQGATEWMDLMWLKL